MNLGVGTIAFGLACAWTEALFSAAIMLLFYAHSERERLIDHEAVAVEVSNE